MFFGSYEIPKFQQGVVFDKESIRISSDLIRTKMCSSSHSVAGRLLHPQEVSKWSVSIDDQTWWYHGAFNFQWLAHQNDALWKWNEMTWEGVSQLVFGKGPFIKTSLEPRSHLGGTDSTPAPSKSPAVHPCQGCQFVAQSSDIVPCSNGCHFFKDKQLVSWEVAVPSLGKKRVENKQRCCFTRFLYISMKRHKIYLYCFFPSILLRVKTCLYIIIYI